MRPINWRKVIITTNEITRGQYEMKEINAERICNLQCSTLIDAVKKSRSGHSQNQFDICHVIVYLKVF